MADSFEGPRPSHNNKITRKEFLKYLKMLPLFAVPGAVSLACGDLSTEVISPDIQAVATAQKENPSLLPEKPPVIKDTQVQIQIYNNNLNDNKTYDGPPGSGLLNKRLMITDQNGTHEKYQFITAKHVITRNPVTDAGKGFSQTITNFKIKTKAGPNQPITSETNLEVLSITPVTDNGFPTDCVIITARSITELLPEEIKELGDYNLQGWVPNPTRLFAAGYPFAAGINDLMISEGDTSQIDKTSLGSEYGNGYVLKVKENSAKVIGGSSGAQISIQTPEIPQGTVVGVLSQTNFTGNDLVISPFPTDIQIQTTTAWNAV